MQSTQEVFFLDIFKNIEDSRAKRNRLYSMSEILLITMGAVICGAEGWQDIYASKFKLW